MLLRSSLESIKSRFQKMAETESDRKAWLVHAHIIPGVEGKRELNIFDVVDDSERRDGRSEDCACGMSFLKVHDDLTRESVGSCAVRSTLVVGWQTLKSPSEKAARLLNQLPDALQDKLWSGLHGHILFRDGLPFWSLAVFELANMEIEGSSLRSERWEANTKVELKSIPQLRYEAEMGFGRYKQMETLGENLNWFSTLNDFAAASVDAIDILLSWLDDEPQPSSETISIRGPGGSRTNFNASITRGGFPLSDLKCLPARIVYELLPFSKELFPLLKVAFNGLRIHGATAGGIVGVHIVGPSVDVTCKTYCPTDTELETIKRAGGDWRFAMKRFVETRSQAVDVEKMEAPEILRRLAELEGTGPQDEKPTPSNLTLEVPNANAQESPKSMKKKRIRKSARASFLVEQAVRNYHKYENGIVDKTVQPISGRKLAALANGAFSASTVDKWFKARFGSKNNYVLECHRGTLAVSLLLKKEDAIRAFGILGDSVNNVGDEDEDADESDESPKRRDRKRSSIERKF